MADLLADVYYHGEKAAVVYWDSPRRTGVFEYLPEFMRRGLELAPLKMPLRAGPFQFPNIHESYSGLPGLLADCLPDTYGNALIDEWLRQQGKSPVEFSPVDRLCYLGERGMGALEFRPAIRRTSSKAEKVEIDKLVELAAKALARKESLDAGFSDESDLTEILRVGTSAGGARAKAVIAWNAGTNEVRSGQAKAPHGFEHWLLKFDGVTSAFDGVRDPQGYGRIEYAYYLMAKEAGIEMMPCRLFEEGSRAHFMTKRFDREIVDGEERKIHYASLFGLGHISYAAPGSHSHSYEDYFETIAALSLSPNDRIEAYRRMVFNVLACNRDDHSKNFGFLMDSSSDWRLAPAFDVTYAHNPAPGKWTASQQLSILGKRENITKEDLLKFGFHHRIATKPKVKTIFDEVIEATGRWATFAGKAGLGDSEHESIRAAIELQRKL